MAWLLIGIGGALGAMARHGVSVLTHARYGADPFPLGVLIVNAVGCLAAGAFAGVVASGRFHVAQDVRLFAMVGLLGGFTTFSAFGVDTFTLMQSGHYSTAAVNVIAQFALTLIAVWAGFHIAHRI